MSNARRFVSNLVSGGMILSDPYMMLAMNKSNGITVGVREACSAEWSYAELTLEQAANLANAMVMASVCADTMPFVLNSKTISRRVSVVARDRHSVAKDGTPYCKTWAYVGVGPLQVNVMDGDEARKWGLALARKCMAMGQAVDARKHQERLARALEA